MNLESSVWKEEHTCPELLPLGLCRRQLQTTFSCLLRCLRSISSISCAAAPLRSLPLAPFLSKILISSFSFPRQPELHLRA